MMGSELGLLMFSVGFNKVQKLHTRLSGPPPALHHASRVIQPDHHVSLMGRSEVVLALAGHPPSDTRLQQYR